MLVIYKGFKFKNSPCKQQTKRKAKSKMLIDNYSQHQRTNGFFENFIQFFPPVLHDPAGMRQGYDAAENFQVIVQHL